MNAPTVLIAAGGTGGHIFPGLAVAECLRARGWRVVWCGHPERMEGRIVAQHGIAFTPLRFAGVRGKGWTSWLKLPATLGSAYWQARSILNTVRPDVVLGMGGYVAFPAGVAAWLRRIPLVIHEQNAVAGSANRWLAKIAHTALAGFPDALAGARVVGNPVAARILQSPDPAARAQARGDTPLRLLVMGGSLGASILNRVVPQALAQLAPEARPHVLHQAGEQHLDSLKHAYADAGVAADCRAFIDDVGAAMADADVLVCRAGAMTVAEVAAVGVATLFVPLPHAIDDHQRANARFLCDCGSAWMQEQNDFTPAWLAAWLAQRTRAELAHMAARARQHVRAQATEDIARACAQAAGVTP